MPLVLAPSFDDQTRDSVEQHLEIIRGRRIAGALEFQRSKLTKLEREGTTIEAQLGRAYDRLGKALAKLDEDMAKVDGYLNTCQILKNELGLVQDRVELARR